MFLLQFAFTRLVEIHSLRDTATHLLDAYVGRAAGNASWRARSSAATARPSRR
jgi:hypothetical protein